MSRRFDLPTTSCLISSMRRESNKRHSKLAYPSIVVQDDLVDNAMMKTPVAYGVAVWPRGGAR
ncbi:hypothetical protein PAHAL_5G214900 [Panicum hallii]|uniref:Uncharacterized protein n=1 Tax=Panicum hallii TaxID=206008 RepID=A0A2T8IKS0_9POAL|nr:hypothetical protein PAHAL_5G214900 [Panicum hallii]